MTELSDEKLVPRDPVDRLLATLDYEFSDPGLLIEALTHRSFVNETKEVSAKDNERLEFLGDAVIDLLVSTELLRRFPFAREGTLSRIRASMVNESRLAAVAASINLGEALRLGRGEALSGGRERASIQADAFESLVAAVYLDGGLQSVDAILACHLEYPDALDLDAFDAKTSLQEQVQARLHVTPHYRLIGETGPDHEKIFTVAVICGADTLSEGTGRTKKDAEQDAAAKALSALRRDSDASSD
jgi:ribonuclease-3